MDSELHKQTAAGRHKAISEKKFQNSNLKSALKHAKKAHNLNPNLQGLTSMITAFKILRTAAKTAPSTDWYKVLQVEPFSHISTIKNKYKKLALILHPDKNPYPGCEDAFKIVGEGFRVLSDKKKREEFDTGLRVRIQEETVKVVGDAAVGGGGDGTFWTGCSRCRILHQFERRYLGFCLVCPSCKKSFVALEVEAGEKDDDNGDGDGVMVGVQPRSERLRRKVMGKSFDDLGIGRKMVGDDSRDERIADLRFKKGKGSVAKSDDAGLRKRGGGDSVVGESLRSVNSKGNGGERLRRKTSTVDEVLERSNPKRVKFGEEMMTLAEMQLEAKRKATREKAKSREKQKGVGDKERRIEEEGKAREFMKESIGLEIENGEVTEKVEHKENKSGLLNRSRNLEIENRVLSRKSVVSSNNKNMSLKRDVGEIMAVEDSDFYDFNRDRSEKSFKKGQVWAIYDDDDDEDRVPRQYGLIDEVLSVNPFRVKLSWLDVQHNGSELLLIPEQMGFRTSCGRFKVSQSTIIGTLNIFSHVVDCERAAREVYRIYPKKGTVWAVRNDAGLDGEGRSVSSARGNQGYDILVMLSTYSEVHGLSAGYLEKVDGFKTVFKRREIGYHGIKCVGKNGVRLFSHQIPARKVCGDEVMELMKDCWELDPASLP